jgi:hypothetical protein
MNLHCTPVRLSPEINRKASGNVGKDQVKAIIPKSVFSWDSSAIVTENPKTPVDSLLCFALKV